MLAGQVESMDTRVFKAEAVSELWGDYPVVFRLFMLPFVVGGVLNHRRENREFIFLDLGAAGEQIDLENEHFALDPDDSESMEVVSYAADTLLPMPAGDGGAQEMVMTVLGALQTVIWCIQGAPIVLVVTGEKGGELPDGSWEFVQQGPQITNIRLNPFSGVDSDTGGDPPAGMSGPHPK